MKKSIIVLLSAALMLCCVDSINAQSFGGKSTKKKVSKVIKAPKVPKATKSKSTKAVTKKGKGFTSKIIDAGARGFGGQLGREAAKSVVKTVKEAIK